MHGMLFAAGCAVSVVKNDSHSESMHSVVRSNRTATYFAGVGSGLLSAAFVGLVFFNMNRSDPQERIPPQSIVDQPGRKRLSWRVLLLPYLGHIDLYSKFRLDEPWDIEWNSKLIEEMPDVFRPVESIDIQPGQTDLMAP